MNDQIEGQMISMIPTMPSAMFDQSMMPGGKLQKEFDIVFSSYGVLGWLPDLDMWANTI